MRTKRLKSLRDLASTICNRTRPQWAPGRGNCGLARGWRYVHRRPPRCQPGAAGVKAVLTLSRRLSAQLDTSGRARPFPRQQARRIVRDVTIQVALVLLLIESIFVAEKLISGLLQEVLSIRASLGKTVALMASLLPMVFELALPTAILIAVYRVALGLREDREFLMLSSLGIPPHGLIRLVVRIGIAAQIAALLVGGFIDPLSRYAFRLIMFSAQYQGLSGGTVTTDKLLETRVGTVIVSPRADGVPTPRLFVRQSMDGGGERIVIANGTRLIGPDATGRVALHLYDFAVDDFASPAAAAQSGRPPIAPITSLGGTSTQQTLVIDDIVPFDPRGRSSSELTLVELMRSAPDNERHRQDLIKRIGRSLLCLMAPLIGLLALSFTNRANQAFVLPIACAGLMTIEIAGTTALGSGLGLGMGTIMGLLLCGGMAIGAALVASVALRSSAIARPGLGRS